MRRTDRLFDIMQILRDGKRHRAQDIAALLGVSSRTIYRDMDRLMAAGVPIQGERGIGYRTTGLTTLPPLTLTPAELEALNLGMAIVAEARDPELKSAALSLADKIDAMLPTRAIADSEAWKYAFSPLANAARGLAHMATLRSAIKSRQKLRLTSHDGDGAPRDHVVRPLQLESWGRVWTLTLWCDTHGDFHQLRTDLIETATPLPELFVDEPGKTLPDLAARRGG